MTDEYRRPAAADDAAVAAAGKVTEAFEWVERARGHLFEFHQLMGHADLLFGDAAEALDEAGSAGLADRLRQEVVGRNVLDGRWTFQVVDEFDDHYYEPVRSAECHVRDALTAGRRHVHEAELKDARRTGGHPAHACRPAGMDASDQRRPG
jgi:hypothetical protein